MKRIYLHELPLNEWDALLATNPTLANELRNYYKEHVYSLAEMFFEPLKQGLKKYHLPTNLQKAEIKMNPYCFMDVFERLYVDSFSNKSIIQNDAFYEILADVDDLVDAIRTGSMTPRIYKKAYKLIVKNLNILLEMAMTTFKNLQDLKDVKDLMDIYNNYFSDMHKAKTGETVALYITEVKGNLDYRIQEEILDAKGYAI